MELFRRMIALIETFFYAFHAIAPIVVLLLLGYYIGRKNYFDRHMLKQLSAFSFRFTMCALMFRNVYEQPSIHSIELNVTILVITSLIFITLAGVILAFSITKQRNRYGVIIQASFRSNYAVLGMVLAENLCGTAGVSAAVGLQASGIFYYNIAAVLCLTMFSDQIEKQINIREIVYQLVTNPMLIGIFAGFCCLIAREFIPRDASGELVFSLAQDLDFIYSCIENLANMTTPLVLLTLGAQWEFSNMGGMRKELVACVLMRLAGAPAIGFLTAFVLQYLGVITLTPAFAGALLGFWGTPMAVAGAIMAEEMGCDGELARQCAVWTSALSMVSLFLWILILRGAGLL